MRQSELAGSGGGDEAASEWSAVLRALREAAGVTQEGWAARLGYGRRTIQRWERGDGAPDAAATEALVRLCGDLRLFRQYRQGALASLTLTADLLRDLLAEARQRERGRAAAAPTALAVLPPPRPAHNLPADLTSFIGRERERAEVARRLAGTRLLTLTGVGGVGKTRLALEVARGLADEYPDGVWLVELAALAEPALVPAAVARSVGVREQPGRAPADALAEALGPRRLLLVLDNCEHLLDACAALAARLLRAGPHLRILATSREPLGVPGEVAWPVPPLAVPDEDEAAPLAALAGAEAVQLFATRAGAARPGFALTAKNAGAVARICRRLDGLPLALELAAARTRALTPEEIAARLDDRFPLLAHGDRAAPPRHRTLRAALDWSYALLDGAERRLFDRLAVFAGDFTLAAAEAVCAGDGIAAGDVFELLARLVGRSLVFADTAGEDGETRYRLLEMVREYAAERLAARGGADPLRGRHAAWVVALAEEAAAAFHGPAEGRWLRRVERSHAEVRAALVWALARGEAETALRLGAVLWWAWGVQGRAAEGRAWLERTLALPGATAPTRPRARVLAYGARFPLVQGDAATVRSWLDEAGTLGRELGDDVALLAVGTMRAQLLQFAGEFTAAEAAIADALALARRLGDVWAECRLLEMRAHAALRGGDAPTAAALLEEDARLARRAGDAWGLATALGELGDLARERGAPAEAGALYAEALALREGLGIPGATPSLRHNLGYVALAAGDLTGAAASFADALDQFRRLGERRGVAECLIGLAGVAAAEGRTADAARLFGAGEAALAALGSDIWPSNRADHERGVALARAALGPAAFAAARAAGRALPPEDAVALALASYGADVSVVGLAKRPPRDDDSACEMRHRRGRRGGGE
ncbi:MAG TPA: helix-turn-helix domain-containing protein [Thermomicrobiales bacterium]|nr:helix-turn-helix domain-containing protein [Thermomicrobiales bacterium]